MKRIVTVICAMAMVTCLSSACDDDVETDAGADGGGGVIAQGKGAGGAGARGGGDASCNESASTADCTVMCEAVIAATCPNGPTQTQCEEQCADLNAFVGACPAWGGVVDCMADPPTFVCLQGSRCPRAAKRSSSVCRSVFPDRARLAAPWAHRRPRRGMRCLATSTASSLPERPGDLAAWALATSRSRATVRVSRRMRRRQRD